MSAKLLHKLRPWTTLTSASGRAQLDPNQTPPTSVAEAQSLMFRMREEALLRVRTDGNGQNTKSAPSVSALNSPVDQDDDLEFPSMTRKELLARCEKELHNFDKPFNRSFRRSSACQGGHDASSIVRVFQWNCLSQALGTKNDKFIRCPPSALDWSIRRWRLLEEIIRYDPDIICLQEVDHFNLIQKALCSIDFYGRFIPKPDSPCIHLDTNNGPDGSAIFFKKSKFERIQKASRTLKVWGVPSNQVILCMILKHKDSGAEVCVATTHLKAKLGTLRSSFRNEQVQDILEWLESIHGDRPVIIGGDFNGEPSEPFYSTLMKNTAVPLVSAYAMEDDNTKEGNLEYTTWKIRETGEQKHILDYIFHSTQLETVSTLDMPSEQQLGEDKLPSLQFASDHLSLVADLCLA